MERMTQPHAVEDILHRSPREHSSDRTVGRSRELIQTLGRLEPFAEVTGVSK
jgi:hypothetical protein